MTNQEKDDLIKKGIADSMNDTYEPYALKEETSFLGALWDTITLNPYGSGTITHDDYKDDRKNVYDDVYREVQIRKGMT